MTETKKLALTAVTENDLIAFVKEQFAETNKRAKRGIGPGHDLAYHVRLYNEATERRDTLQLALRLGMPVEVPDTDALALNILATVERLPELHGRPPHARPTREQVLPAWPEDEQGPFLPRFPNLWHATQEGKQVMLVGGTPEPKKTRWACEAISGDAKNETAVEWLGSEDERSERVSLRVAQMMKAGTVCAVVFFPEFMAHVQTRPIQDATRTTGVPSCAGGRAGHAALLEAFEKLDRELAPAAATG